MMVFLAPTDTMPVLILVLGVILLIMGFVFAYAGRKVWHMLVVLIGAVIGGLLGAFIGYVFLGSIGALIGGLIGSFIGSQIFGYVAEAAVPIALGILIFIIVFLLTEGNIIVSAVVALAVLVLAFFMVDVLLTVITAAIGGILALFGVVFIGAYYEYATEELVKMGAILGVILFFTGLIVQMLTVKEERDAIKAKLARSRAR